MTLETNTFSLSNNEHDDTTTSSSSISQTPPTQFESNNDNMLSQTTVRPPDLFEKRLIDTAQQVVTTMRDRNGHLKENVTLLLAVDDFIAERLCTRKAYLLGSRPMAPSQYGKVLKAELVVEVPNEDREKEGVVVEWQGTGQTCFVKMSSCQKIQCKRLEYHYTILPEDPFREAHAMQYLKEFHFHREDNNGLRIHDLLLQETHVQELQRIRDAVIETHVMLPYDILQDSEILFLIMPDVDGMEMYHLLQEERFTIEKARTSFIQMLDCVEFLQRAGVCHRDISLENFLMTSDGIVVLFDFGMCLKIPCLDGEGLDHRTWTRCLMSPQVPSMKVGIDVSQHLISH